MKRIIPALLALGLLFAAVPAFACDGHGGADKASGDDTIMTSVDDGKKADAKDAKKKKAKKDAKKGEKKSAETTDGEV